MKKFGYTMCVFMLIGAAVQVAGGRIPQAIGSLGAAGIAFWLARTWTPGDSDDVSNDEGSGPI